MYLTKGTLYGSAAIVFRVNAEILRKTALPFLRAADCRLYGNDRQIGAEDVKFLQRKTFIVCLLSGKLSRRKICNQSNILNDPRALTKPVHGGYIRNKQNPVNGQNSFRSQGLIYNNFKMTIYKLPSLRLTAKS